MKSLILLKKSSRSEWSFLCCNAWYPVSMSCLAYVCDLTSSLGAPLLTGRVPCFAYPSTCKSVSLSATGTSLNLRIVGLSRYLPAAVVAAVRSRALRRIFRLQYHAGRLIFSGVCRAIDPVRKRLSHGVAYLREDAPGPTNISDWRELERVCGRLYRGLLRASGVVTPARHHSWIEERQSLHRSSVRRPGGKTLARMNPGICGKISCGYRRVG